MPTECCWAMPQVRSSNGGVCPRPCQLSACLSRGFSSTCPPLLTAYTSLQTSLGCTARWDMEWLDWLADACFSLPGVLGFHPLPGTRQHRELSLRARREYNEERFKPAEQRDPERVRQLRIQDLRLGIEEGEVNPLLAPFAAAAQQWRWSCPALHHRWPHAIQFTAMQFRVACLELKFREWQAAAARAACCAGSKCAHRRLAASCAARARFYRVRARQAQEELSAALERRPIRIVELARIELPARVVEEMRGVPATDLCAACAAGAGELEGCVGVWECGRAA